ncbi:hypothetical protein B0H17DRAFT_1148548 [Mycena rosella]|uniref:Uncharacterized protein n=1 Tax=Mycena rosella TaxID=1033263 RepID=A0AAD7CAA8_MYCRO|nr:hypothetical protein B0H17DRAFT_1148548 [Mycena rosella]
MWLVSKACIDTSVEGVSAGTEIDVDSRGCVPVDQAGSKARLNAVPERNAEDGGAWTVGAVDVNLDKHGYGKELRSAQCGHEERPGRAVDAHQRIRRGHRTEAEAGDGRLSLQAAQAEFASRTRNSQLRSEAKPSLASGSAAGFKSPVIAKRAALTADH